MIDQKNYGCCCSCSCKHFAFTLNCSFTVACLVAVVVVAIVSVTKRTTQFSSIESDGVYMINNIRLNERVITVRLIGSDRSNFHGIKQDMDLTNSWIKSVIICI